MVLVDRPKAAPISTLVIVISIAATQLTLQLNQKSKLSTQDLPNVLAIFSAFGAIAAISCMPFRNPELPSEKISAPFDPPSSAQRSPEDLLTPWQFLSVAWMNPLISIGSQRQLNDEDVWSLGYQFQHKGLHERFRELKGSVVRRLLAANGIDLVILTALGLLETISCKVLISGVVKRLTFGSVRGTRASSATTAIHGGHHRTSESSYSLRNLATRRQGNQMSIISRQYLVWT